MSEVQWASEIQQRAFQYGPFPMCMSGGWGSGKSFAGCLKALWLSDTFPRNRGVIARSVAKELRQTTMATFYKMCPPSAYANGRRNDQDGSLVLNNGSEILWLHLDNPDTEGILSGLEINWFLIDQAEESPERMEGIFDKLLGRLGRWDVAEVPQWLIDDERKAGRDWKWHYPDGRPMPAPYAMLAVNPDTELHWVYRRFHPDSPEFREKYRARGYKMFHMPSLENRFLSDVNKEQLLAHDESFVRRYVKGEWGLPEGVIHTVDPLSLINFTSKDEADDYIEFLRRTCVLNRVLDHGDSAPTACAWFAVDRNGNVIFYREYYQPNKLISQHRQNITDLSAHESYTMNLADPSIFHKTSQKFGGRWSVSDEYMDVREHPQDTAIYWSAADNNELATRNRINEYLHVHRNLIHPITKQEGSPRIFFVMQSECYPNGCAHMVQQLKSQRRVKIGTDGGKPTFSDERDPDIPDHGYDLVRYAVASRAPRAIPSQKAPRGSYLDVARSIDAAQHLRHVR